MNVKDDMVEPKSAPVGDNNQQTLEKQLRDRDIAFKKEKALLAQKIELLNIQLKDSQEREESNRRLHDTMFSAFKQDSKNGSQSDYENFDNLLREYEQKIARLTERNLALESGLSKHNQVSSFNNTKSVENNKEFMIEKLTNTLDQLKSENQKLKDEIELYISTDTEQRVKRLGTEHQNYMQSLDKRYESSLVDMSELHKQDKYPLTGKMESKQTFTFGEKSQKNRDSETQSNYSLKDEIDKLHFIIEEKEYMNAELKQEIIILREQVARLKQKS